MKIKILKDIPGYTKGVEITPTESDTSFGTDFPGTGFHSYRADKLIEQGWAEEIKDDIDIEAIRRRNYIGRSGIVCSELLEFEIKFFEAYRIVKAVIEQLNCDWKPDSTNDGWQIDYHHGSLDFSATLHVYIQYSILPLLKSNQNAQKVIKLCEPELKVLFGVK